MRLGFVSAILPDQTLEEVLSIAAAIGYDCVEVMCWPKGVADRRYAGVTHIDVNDINDDGLNHITQVTKETGIAISALGYYPNPLDPDPEASDRYVGHICTVIEVAARLGLKHMNSFVGRDHTKSIADNWPRFLEIWKPILKLAEEKGIYVGIENCPMLFTDDEWPGGKNLATSPATWTRMFDEIGSDHFGLNYDPSHMIWQHMDYLAPMRHFADRLFHIHAKDVRIDRHNLNQVGIMAPPNQWHTPKLPGLGDVNWGQFFSTLTSAGYHGDVCVEVEDRAYEGSLDQRIAALQQSHDYLRQFVPKQSSYAS